MTTRLFWNKCKGEVWCPLNTVNLPHPHFDNMFGVYIIWHGGSTPKTVYVGQGEIRDRLTAHRSNTEIQKFASIGLYVTWARLNPDQCDGVERYLSDRLKPIIGDRHPEAEPIEVTLPW